MDSITEPESAEIPPGVTERPLRKDAERNRRLAIAVPVSEVPQAVRRNNA